MKADNNRMFSTNPPREEPGLTIVGGRPPGEGNAPSQIPRGIEVLIKKAAVDPEFRALLIAKRDEAAKEIGLELTAMEKNIIRSAPESQLVSIINSVKVAPNLKPILLGKVAGVMLAALTATSLFSCSREAPVEGIRPDIPEKTSPVNTPAKPIDDSPIRGEKIEYPEIISPTDYTDAGVTNINWSSATLNSIIQPNGLATTVYFEYGETTAYGNSTPAKDIGAGIDPIVFSADLTGLKPNITYNFRIALVTPRKTIYGANRTFTTANVYNTIGIGGGSAGMRIERPRIIPATNDTDTGVTNITQNSATLNAIVDPNGVFTSIYFEYGETTAYGTVTATQDIGNGISPVNVSAVLTGLKPNTTYNFRIILLSRSGAFCGATKTFTTANVPNNYSQTKGITIEYPYIISPTNLTDAGVTNITMNSAALNGIVQPNSLVTVAYFEYGETKEYGKATSKWGIGRGIDPVNIIEVLTGLKPNTAYNFRIVLETRYKTIYGVNKTFSTTN